MAQRAKPQSNSWPLLMWPAAACTLGLLLIWAASLWSWLAIFEGPREVFSVGMVRVLHGSMRVHGYHHSWKQFRTDYMPTSFGVKWWMFEGPTSLGNAIEFPLWPLVLACGGVSLIAMNPAGAWRLASRPFRRRKDARVDPCPACRYDRTGLARDRPCPECGHAPRSGL